MSELGMGADPIRSSIGIGIQFRSKSKVNFRQMKYVLALSSATSTVAEDFC